MTRLLFWIALVILVVMAVRSKLRAAMARAQGQAPQGRGPAQPAAGAGGAGTWQRVEDRSEPMACCAQCGIYFPASEAVRVGGRDFCSTAHAHQPAPR
jgi:uncharacterized protein